ncbi:MAG: hypothetical protein IJV39_04995 [Ruminococcus sp.]|nr:hypothetical protein [Ruminococcus sp.]
MKYFKIAYNMLINRILFNLVIVLEIAAVLVLTNTVVATWNSKTMLYDPYKDILKNDGMVIYTGALDSANTAVLKKIQKENGYNEVYMDNAKVAEYVEKTLKGDVKVYRTSVERFPAGENNGPTSTISTDNESNILYYLMDKEVFDKFRLPLSEGRWASAEKNSDGEIEIVVSQGTTAELNKVYDTPAGKIKVVGILTSNTYTPPGTNANRSEDSSELESLFNYTGVFDLGVSTDAFAIVNRELFTTKGEMYHLPEDFWFVSYGKGLSSDDIKGNDDYLMENIGEAAMYDSNGDYETFKALDNATQNEINKIYLQMLPIVLAALIVVLAGLIGSVAISTVKQIKNFGIFFLCGCRWKDCKKIITAQLAVLFAISCLFTVLSIWGMNAMNLNADMGLTFKLNNVLISLAILAVMYLLAIILPRNIIKTSSPVETIKENV